MKKTFKYLLIIFLGASGFQSLKAQDSIKVYDLAVLIDHERDENFMNDSIPIPPGIKELDFSVLFKVNRPEDVDQVYIFLGSEKNASDYKQVVMNIIKEGTELFMISANNEKYTIYKNSAWFNTKIPVGQMENIKWLTVYVKDKAGNLSDKKYFQVN